MNYIHYLTNWNPNWALDIKRWQPNWYSTPTQLLPHQKTSFAKMPFFLIAFVILLSDLLMMIGHCLSLIHKRNQRIKVLPIYQTHYHYITHPKWKSYTPLNLSQSVRLCGFSLCFFIVSPFCSCCFIHFPSVCVHPFSAGSICTTDSPSAVARIHARPVTQLRCLAFRSSYCLSASCRLLIVFITLLIVSFISPHM